MLFRNSLLLLCCLYTSSSFAARWFEIEVLIYKQRPAPYLQEDFSLKHDEINAKNKLDLLTPALEEQARQACIEGDTRFKSNSFTLSSSGVMVAHFMPTPCSLIALAASTVI